MDVVNDTFVVAWFFACTSAGMALPFACSSLFLPYGNAFAGKLFLYIVLYKKRLQ